MSTDQQEQFTIVSSMDEFGERHKEWEQLWIELAGSYAEVVSFELLKDAIRSTDVGRKVPDDVILGALEKADRNNDGEIQKSEFMEIVQQPPRTSLIRRALVQYAWCAVPRSQRDYDTRRYFQYYSCRPPPLFVPLVSLVQIGAFIYYAVDMGLPMAPMSPCPTYSPLVYDPARRQEAWRYLTYMTIHSGYLHLLSNLLTQIVFGVVLEMVHGPLRVSVIYMSGVVCGALSTSVSTPMFFLAGASGGVYALQYAHLGNLIINWGEMKYPIPQAAFIALLSAVDISYSIYDTFFVSQPSHTGHLAHIGGALCGILLGICVLRNLRKLDWERYCVWAAASILSLLVLTTMLVNIVAVGYYPEKDTRPIPELRQEWMMQHHPGYYYIARN